jgi:transcriptional regulator with XRE-family HTH domain
MIVINKLSLKEKADFVSSAFKEISDQSRNYSADEVFRRVNLVSRMEKILKTDFRDTQDFIEKVTQFLKKASASLEKNEEKIIRVKSLGDRLRIIRKKLRWDQVQLAECLDVKSKQIISLYEKGLRSIPDGISEWIKDAESMLEHLSRKKVSDLLKMRKSPQEKSTENAKSISPYQETTKSLQSPQISHPSAKF